MGILKRKRIRQMISSVLVLSLTCASMDGLNIRAAESKAKDEDFKVTNTQEVNFEEGTNLATTDTTSGKVSEQLTKGYLELEKAYEEEQDIQEAMDKFVVLVGELKQRQITQLNKEDQETGEIYSDLILNGFNALQNILDKFTEGNAESTLKQIKAMVDPEKPYIKLSDELPNQDVTVDDIKTEEYSEDTASDYVPDEELEYSKSDLEQTNDTVLNDEIRTQFAELKTPIQIYEYIRNNVQPEFYYGSRKGAIGAFDQKAGNDYDIASLLIGVLRDKGTPARYVRGDIEITADQAMKWTATKNINVAVRQLVALGIPTTALLQNGEVVAVRMEHVWVEAYVPYTDYRGSGSQTGDKLWIPLDPSFKKSEYKPGIDWSQVKYYMENESNDISNMTDFVGVDMSEMSAFIGGENSAAMKYLIENGYADATKEEVFGGRAIISEKQKYLPLSLPYQVSTKKDSFADIPEDVTDSITVSLHGNSAFGTNFSGSDYFNKKIYTPDVYGKRITINYAPATEADKEVLNEYGGLFKTPAYLLKLRPQLLVDGEVVAEGTACSAGYQQQYEIKIHNGSKLTNDSNVSNKITAGGIYCIALDYGKIGAGEMQGIAGDLDKIKDSLSAENIYTDDAMGEMLNGVAKSYFAQLDMYNEVIAGQKSVTAYRNLTLGIVGFNVNVKYTFQQPTELNEGGFSLISHMMLIVQFLT